MALCERCKKAQATFHLTKIDPNGEKFERHVCERCSIEEGHIPAGTAKDKSNFGEQLSAAKESANALHAIVCDECGTSYVEFRNQGPLGCPNDYNAFGSELANLIGRAHDGSMSHVGKTPRSFGQARTTEQNLTHLRRELDEAVAAENYERAVELRDRIRKLESA